MELWFISSGQYSDYRVSYVTDSEEEANEIVRLLNSCGQRSSYDNYYVEPAGPLSHSADIQTLDVLKIDAKFLYETGEWIEISEMPIQIVDFPENFNDKLVSWNTWYREAYQRSYGSQPEHVVLALRGTDFERVRKTYSEVKARITAQPEYYRENRYERGTEE